MTSRKPNQSQMRVMKGLMYARLTVGGIDLIVTLANPASRSTDSTAELNPVLEQTRLEELGIWTVNGGDGRPRASQHPRMKRSTDWSQQMYG